jgi:hypothetical protein
MNVGSGAVLMPPRRTEQSVLTAPGPRNQLQICFSQAVQLQHNVGRQSDVLGVAVNHAQDLAVARNLLLGTIRWRGAVGDKVPDTLQWRDDALDAVR